MILNSIIVPLQGLHYLSYARRIPYMWIECNHYCQHELWDSEHHHRSNRAYYLEQNSCQSQDIPSPISVHSFRGSTSLFS